MWRRAVGAAPSHPLPLLPAAAAAPRQDSRAAEGRRRGEAPRIIHSSSLSLVATGLAILRPPPRHGTARLFRFFLFSRAGGAAALADRSRRAPRLPSCGRFSGRRRRRRLRPSGRGRHATRSAGAGAPPFFLQPFSFPSLAARAGAGAPISATSAAPACPSAMRHKNSFQGIICCSEQGRHGVAAGESGSRDGRFVFRIHVWIRPGHKFFSHKCYPNVFSSFICTNSLKA